jgi:hypothetical protein
VYGSAPAEKIVLHLPQGKYLVGAKPNGTCAGSLRENKCNDARWRNRHVPNRDGDDDEDFFILPTTF